MVLYLTWLYRDRHTPRMRGSPLCLGLELGNLEVFPRLLPHHGEGPRKCAGLMDGWGSKRDKCGHPSLPLPELFLTGKWDTSITFVLQLVKTAELDPFQNYLFGLHPHGVLVVGVFSNFCTEATGFSLGLSLFLSPLSQAVPTHAALLVPSASLPRLHHDQQQGSPFSRSPGAGCHLTFLILGWGRGCGCLCLPLSWWYPCAPAFVLPTQV